MRRSLFGSWDESAAYLVIVATVTCGVFGAPLWSLVMAAITLSVMTWTKRWSSIVTRANDIDAEYRELATMLWSRDPLRAMRLFFEGHNLVVVVVVTHMLHNIGHCAVAFVFGAIIRAGMFDWPNGEAGALARLVILLLVEIAIVMVMAAAWTLIENKTKHGRWW